MKRYDESPLTGQALYTVTPATSDELCAAVRTAAQAVQPVRCIGGATNFVGSAVPQQAAVIYTTKLNRLLQLEYIEAADEYHLTAEAGLSIGDLQAILAGKQLMFDDPDEKTQAALATLKADRGVYFFPPDPSEGGATLGGVLAASSGGSSAYAYGQSKDYFVRATYVDYAGAVHRTDSGSTPADRAEAIHLLYGSEGQQGIICDVTIRLLRAPATVWSTLIHFDHFADLLNFKQAVRDLTPPESTGIVAFDFFSHDTVRRTIELGSTFPAFKRMSGIRHSWKLRGRMKTQSSICCLKYSCALPSTPIWLRKPLPLPVLPKSGK
jgi:FAD/FMN-containing dehydrogenase